MFVFTEAIKGLDTGDEIGIFDANAIPNNGDCSDQRDTLLVGVGVWSGEQLTISAIGSDNTTCDIDGGYQIPGFVDGNPITIRVWDISIAFEYETSVTLSEGEGIFYNNNISSVTVITALNTYTGCTSPAALTCEVHADLFEDCVTCPDIPCDGFYDSGATYEDGSCIYPTYGCTDSTALNYDSNATNSDGSCDYPPLIGIKIKNIDLENQTLEVWYNSPVKITSYQVSITGADIPSIVGEDDTLDITDGSLMGQVVFENSTGTFCTRSIFSIYPSKTTDGSDGI